MQYQSANLTPKIKYIPYTLCALVLIICARLFYLQIDQNHALLTQSERNCTRIEKIPSPRGNIVDAFDNLLATNRPLTSLYWQGKGNHVLNVNQLLKLEKIGNILNKPLINDHILKEGIAFAEKKYKKLLLASDLSFEQLSQIQEQFSTDDNLIVSTHFKRYYPYKTFACHLLGYLGQINADAQGRMGLEKMFEEELKGEHGTTVKKINSMGRSLAELQLKDALSGSTLKTTIDIELQDIVEQIFPENQSGACILMNPENGSIVSMVSRPNFDPNIFLEPINHEQWQDMQGKQPFLNRAFNSCYPPGSIFKLVTMCAALENGLIYPESCLSCHGYTIFAERKYHCARKTGHGYLSACQALAQSCNIMFFDIGRRISIDTLAEYAHKFGLGQKTNICFPEKDGLIPTSEWKKRVKKERWWPGETLSAAIGQSFILTTPVQIARMISSIFTGYLSTPRILENEPIARQPLDIKPATLEFLQQSMKSVVTKGTGIGVSRVKSITIYAKTSTAQVANLDKTAQDKAFLEHAWFVAYFQYKDNEPLTLVILAENVGSSREATHIAKNFLIEYKKLMDRRVNPTA
jgi:penicillin-binding protein 2